MCYSEEEKYKGIIILILTLMMQKVYLATFFKIFVDDKTAWECHIANVRNKSFMFIAILNKAKYILNSISMYALNCSLILQHISYCIETSIITIYMHRIYCNYLPLNC